MAGESTVGHDQGGGTTHVETDTEGGGGEGLKQHHQVSYSDLAKGFDPQTKEQSKKSQNSKINQTNSKRRNPHA